MGTWAAIAVTVWIGTGLITGVWLLRRGHEWRWLIIAAVLGPLMVPAALERAERSPRVADSGSDGSPAPATATHGTRILVGIDGSPEADRALGVALGLLGAQCGLVVLAEVVSHDDTDPDDPGAIQVAERHLAQAAALAPSATVNVEVLAGSPGDALLHCAVDNELDVIVVGRRGGGLSEHLLGSVSAHLVRHSDIPVLVIEPPTSPPKT